MRRAWWVIAGWLAAAAAIIAVSPSLSDITSADQGSFLPRSYESVQALELAERAFPQQSTATAIIVVKRADGQPLTAADEAAVGQLAQTLQGMNIARTSGYLTGPQAVAPDRSIQLVNVGLESVAPDDPALLDAVRQIRVELGAALSGTALAAGVAGDVASFVDNEDTFTNAFAIVGIAFAVLMLAPISFLQQMGFAVALGIVLSAFVMSMFFVPALTALVGHTAWWPGHGDQPTEAAHREPVTTIARPNAP